MARVAKFCPNCGQPLTPGIRFCESCGHQLNRAGPISEEGQGDATAVEKERLDGAYVNPNPNAYQRYAVPPAPRRQTKFGDKLPWVISGFAVGALLLVLVGIAVYNFSNSSRPGQQAASIPPTESALLSVPEATGTAAANTAPDTPTETAASTVTASPTSPPIITATHPPESPAVATPTLSATAASGKSGYDLYVKRINYVPAGAELVAGTSVSFKILIATDIYPASGPYFPTSRFRWRPGDGTDWTEALCPASTQNAGCSSTVDYTFVRPGNYAFEIEVDNRGEIDESNESNNSGQVAFQINAPPIPTPIPTVGASFGAVTFSTEFDQNNQVPVNPGKSFPFGAKIIYSWWTYSGIVPGTEYVYTFYKDGAFFYGSSDRFTYASGNAWQWMLIGDYPTVPLDPATYSLTISVNNKVVNRGSFVIQPPTLGGPIPGAFSVFFTVQDGNPTGWVYDKQGSKHTPVSRTISNLRIAPGDRIVLQTDQTRFSLLFDCSTTPGTFDPCDFMSDSTANLPGQIRVVRSGMSAFLNISRADNWAGPRNGFPGQRYPADPVLRIVFSW